jgi:Holliday junction DNA helicase RuvA
VSGIGPKVAIGILNGGKPEVIAAAIQQENVAFLTKLPGVGKKTAQRIVLDLKDKLAAYAGAAAGLESGLLLMGEAGGLPGGGAAGTGVWSEAKQALLALGYTEAEADRAGHSVKAKIKETDSVDAVIKLALQALFQGV